MVIPSTIRGLVQTRSHLTGMLRAFHVHGPRGLFAFGRHNRAEAVILAWPLFEQLTEAAHALQDAAHAVELDRRRRNPRGPAKVSLTRIAELLGVPAPPAPRPPAKNHQLTVWPTALDDVMRIGDEQAPAARQAIADALAGIVSGQQTGTPMVSQPGQPPLAGYHRVVVPLGAAGGAAVVVFGQPTEGRTPTIDLLAVLPAAELVSALHMMEDAADLEELTRNADGGE